MVKIYDLKTNGRKNPLGMDERTPIFAWKLSSDETGVMQEYYQILVAVDEAFTELVWDSGKVASDKSLGIRYEGDALKASIRYYWKVIVQAKGQTVESTACWFETGLMSTEEVAWNGAKWIGSPKATQNTDGVTTYAVKAEVKAEKSGIVVAARNQDNYVLVETDMKNQLVKIYEYCDNMWDGSAESGVVPTVTVRGEEAGYAIPASAKAAADSFNSIAIEVDGTTMTVTVNGELVLDKCPNIIPDNPHNQPKKAFMMLTGIRQLDNSAVYRKLEISNTKTGVVYQSDDFATDNGILSALGTVKNHELIVENEFHLINAVPTVNVRKTFSVDKKIEKARLYASAMGVYDVYLNGKKANESFLNPGFTDYRKRIHYQTYDVTELVKQGENTLGAAVGKGYYTGYVGYTVKPMVYGEQNTFIGQLVLTYEDGSVERIVTDGSWQFTDKSAIIVADFQQGEHQDARIAIDWNDMSDGRFGACKAYEWPTEVIPTNGTLNGSEKFELSAQEGPSAVVERILKPIGQVVENPKGHFVYDFGQNMVGTVRLTLRGERGKAVKLRYGEMTYKNGELYIQNLRPAANTDVYTFRGDEAGEEFLPAFTFHGFRYMEITGSGYELTREELDRMVLDIEGLVLTNVTDMRGSFLCSNPAINQLQSNIEWGQRDNTLMVFTDCPQRNERMGWTGDAQVFAATAAYNMDIQSFMNKWLQDVVDGQLMYNRDGAIPDTAPLGGDNRRMGGCAGWGDAGVIVPWEMYLAYGDVEVLERFYPMMKKWVDYQSLDERQCNGVRTVNGVEVPEKSDLSSENYIQVQQSRGDHLTFDESTPFILSATAYAAYVAKLLVNTAEILGKSEDVKKYSERYEKVKKAFREAWVKEDGSIGYWGEMSKSVADIHGNIINETYYSNEEGNPNHPSQTAYALAIDFGLIPEEKLKRAAECFKQAIDERGGKLSVGFLGISHLAPALTKAGYIDTAFALLEQEENPSWLYSVKNGATTIWERWNSYIAETGEFGDVNMNSFNHYAYGAIGEWMYHTILGINTGTEKGETGYKKIILTPHAGGSLTYANGVYESAYGEISSAWERKGNSFIYKCSIPANTTAALYLPGETEARELVSGEYSFTVEL